MKKYKLTNETKNESGVTLYRIKALRDFSDVAKGELGGWIESEKNLSHSGEAWVYGEAQVYGEAWVYGEARVYGESQVYGEARVGSESRVGGEAWVYGKARVYGESRVYGEARVGSEARVYGEAQVYGEAWVYGEARVGSAAIATKTVINIIGLSFIITICDNSVQIGCKFFLKTDIEKIKFNDVKNEVTNSEFEYFKKLIKTLI